MEGDVQVLNICLDRLIPPRRDRPVSFELPAISSAADAAAATAGLLAAASRAELSIDETRALVRLLETYTKLLTVEDFERRLTKLEGSQEQ